MNLLELYFLETVEYNLYISTEEYQGFEQSLQNHVNQIDAVQQQEEKQLVHTKQYYEQELAKLIQFEKQLEQ